MRNPYKQWTQTFVDDLSTILPIFETDKPRTGGFDTETTGLHIKKDKPFLIQFGWLVPGEEAGKVFMFYPTLVNMGIFFQLAKKFKYLVGANVKYDCHMLANIGYQQQVEELTNLCELQAVARLSLEAVPARDGGDSLALKELGKKYIHPEASKSEHLIKQNLKAIRDENIKMLTAALKQFPIEGEFTVTGRQKYWGKGAIEKFLKDPTQDLEDLPPDVRDVWESWQEDYPEPTYEDVDRDLMIQYGGEDIVTTLELFKKFWATLLSREQLPILERENKAILPLFRMERVGMKTNRQYLEDSRQRVKNYIIKKRNQLKELAGQELTVGQHDLIKKIFKERWQLVLESSDKAALKQIQKFGGEPEAFAKTINQLRTLEKWYATYILRLLKLTEYDGRAYTQISQCSAVSGRVGSDFQQFPKDPLLDEEGNELFHPREPFEVSGGEYDKIVYVDYSQVELRVAAHYTILVSGGDPNLCRAYFPFQVDEKDWEPTDIHTETTKKAYPNLIEGTPEFKKARGKGKMTNFLCLYGGTAPALASSLDVPMEEAIALHQGYIAAFPHLQIYSKKVVDRYRQRGFVQNMLGRRYYLSNPRDAYKLANYNIQGTCADALKQAIIELDEFLLNYRTRFQMNIHDECSFELAKGEEHIIPRLVQIMEDVFKGWCQVPIKADVEITETNWKEKQDYVECAVA